jgi:hypothetical protein
LICATCAIRSAAELAGDISGGVARAGAGAVGGRLGLVGAADAAGGVGGDSAGEVGGAGLRWCNHQLSTATPSAIATTNQIVNDFFMRERRA